MEVLKQSQYTSYKTEEQVVSFYCVTNGYFDDIPTEQVRTFEHDLITSLDKTEILNQINNKKEITEEIKKELDDYIIKYKRDLIR